MKKCSVCQEMVTVNQKQKHEHRVNVRNRTYTYNLFYDRLQSPDDKIGCIVCVRCHNDSFRISYGDYECIANCTCGHSFTIYDG